MLSYRCHSVCNSHCVQVIQLDYLAGVGVEPTISTRYERGMIFRFTHPQIIKELKW